MRLFYRRVQVWTASIVNTQKSGVHKLTWLQTKC